MFIVGFVALVLSILILVLDYHIDKKLMKEIGKRADMMLAMKKDYDTIKGDLMNWALTIEERSDCVPGKWCMGCQYCKAISTRGIMSGITGNPGDLIIIDDPVRDELGGFTRYICGKGICKNYKEAEKKLEEQ